MRIAAQNGHATTSRALRGAVALVLALALTAIPHAGAVAATVDGGAGEGVAVAIDWDVAEYDTVLDYTVRVEIDPAPGGYEAPYYVRVSSRPGEGTSQTGQIGANGGEVALSGTVTGSVLERDSYVRVVVWAANSYGTDTHILYDHTVNLPYVDTPAQLDLQPTAWQPGPDGLVWAARLSWDSLGGAVDEVCSKSTEHCRARVYALTADGAEHLLRPNIAGQTLPYVVLPRNGRGDLVLTNAGGVAPEDLHYTAIYARVAATAENGEPVTLSSVPVAVEGPEPFVYVALGDSYQSGEGAGNSVAGSDAYLGAYEDGTNFPGQVGAQNNTYTPNLFASGDGCHRAIGNYPKVNAPLLEGGAEVVLVDVTCSGSEIEPGGSKPPIVGTVGEGISPASQVAQAIARLADEGIDPAEVDLVTVGMGGNDARFGDIIKACVIPNLFRRLMEKYPDPPGELELLTRLAANCANYDAIFTKTDADIEALRAKEVWAQEQLLAAFPNARILQVNYPDIIPSGEGAPAWCGGMRKEDLDFARGKAARVDAIIRETVASNPDPRLEFVELETALGENALCPGNGDAPLAVGMSEENLNKELDRLLNLDGNGDAVSRAKLDDVARQYRDVRACAGNKFNPFDGDCDMKKESLELKQSIDDAMGYIGGEAQLQEIFSNVIEPPGPGAESDGLRFDKTRGLFHPNARGHEVLACRMLAAYSGGSGAGCVPSTTPSVSSVNGAVAGLRPFGARISDLLRVAANGFVPGSQVNVSMHSEIIDLGTFPVDDAGLADFTVQIPDVSPGVHLLQVAGVGAGGVQVVREFKVKIDGDPEPGGTYGVYLTGFDGGDLTSGVVEYVDVEYLGIEFAAIPDEEGGIFLELPVPENSGLATLSATSRLTGRSIDKVVAVDNPDDGFFQWWRWSGWQVPKHNKAKAGWNIPLAFQILDGDGRPVRDADAFEVRVYPIDCSTGAELGGYDVAKSAPWWTHWWHRHDGPRYLYNGWWSFTWDTDRDLRRTCQSIAVVVDDGGRHDMWFRFR